jgi:methyl-accepting chemotaxis protein
MVDTSHNQQDLAERLDFVGLDERAREMLRQLQPLIKKSIGPALDLFYAKVRSEPATKRFFSDDRHVSAAKGLQEQHWTLITDAKFNEDYSNAVLKIGRVHARIGLEPRWYIGGYALVIEQLIHSIVKEQWPSLLQFAKGRPERVAEGLSVVVKAAMIDMDLAISVYLEALAEERHKAEEAGKEALRKEREIVAESIGVGLKKLAAKDLTYRMTGEIPDAYHQLQTDFNDVIVHLEEAMVSVSGSISVLSSGSQEISTASDDLARRTEQQAASLEETAAALGAITETVKKSADGASHAREIVAAADQDAKKSAVVVRHAVEAMDGIAESARKITQIIGVIDEIAFQTNLLALNAGVEAARAGDAGRGFAVVASEVRALAQRSAEAAKEIKGLISASSAQVDQGVKLVDETGKSLERIMTQVADINTVVSEIAAGAKEQAQGIEEVNTAITQMDQMTQQNAAMVEESTAASHHLSQEATQLAGLVNQFKIGKAGDDHLRRALKDAAPHAFRQAGKAPAPAAKKPAANAARAPQPAQRNPRVAAGGSAEGGWDEF